MKFTAAEENKQQEFKKHRKKWIRNEGKTKEMPEEKQHDDGKKNERMDNWTNSGE